jgi:hypothetical protein
MSDIHITISSPLAGLDDDEKSLKISCKGNRRQGNPVTVPLHVLQASKLLQTLTLCPDSEKTSVPLQITKQQWDKMCTLLSNLNKKQKTIHHPCSRVHLMSLIRLLPICSYLDLDGQSMSLIGLSIMKSMLHPVHLVEEEYEELLSTIQQHLPLSRLLHNPKFVMDTMSLTMCPFDYRMLLLMNRGWKPWIPHDNSHVHTLDVPQRPSLTVVSPFLTIIKEYIFRNLLIESCLMRKPHYSKMVMEYCRAYINEEEVQDLEVKINNMLEDYRCFDSERQSFWRMVHQISRQKQIIHHRRIMLTEKRNQMRDELAVFLADHGFPSKDRDDLGLSSTLFTNGALDCSIKFYGSLMPPYIYFSNEELAPLENIMMKVIEREWTGFRIRDYHMGDVYEFQTPIFHSLEALRGFLERTEFGILDVLVLKKPTDPIHVDLKDQVIPASNELPWEIRVVDRVVKVNVHPDAEYIRPGPIARKFLHVIKRLAK